MKYRTKPRCKAPLKGGGRCTRGATGENQFCWFHMRSTEQQREEWTTIPDFRKPPKPEAVWPAGYEAASMHIQEPDWCVAMRECVIKNVAIGAWDNKQGKLILESLDSAAKHLTVTGEDRMAGTLLDMQKQLQEKRKG